MPVQSQWGYCDGASVTLDEMSGSEGCGDVGQVPPPQTFTRQAEAEGAGAPMKGGGQGRQKVELGKLRGKDNRKRRRSLGPDPNAPRMQKETRDGLEFKTGGTATRPFCRRDWNDTTQKKLGGKNR